MVCLHNQTQGTSPTQKLRFIVIKKLKALIYLVQHKEKRELPIEMAE